VPPARRAAGLWRCEALRGRVPPQQRRQRGLAGRERLAPQVVAVERDQVERVQEHARVVAAVADAIEARHPVVVADDGLSIDDAGRERRRASDSTIKGKR
jgi:hypothetical protein